MARGGRSRVLLDDAGGGELLVRLLVEVVPVGDDDEGPVARHRPQDLLREEDHRDRLAGALGVPEDPELCARRAGSSAPWTSPGSAVGDAACRTSCNRASALFTPRYWWLRATSLTSPPGSSWKTVKLPTMSRRRSGAHMPRIDRLDRDPAFLALGVDLLPFEEVLPGRGDRPHLGLRAVREDDEPVGDEDVGDRVAVVGEVVVVGVLEVAVRRLQLDEDERDAVDEAEQVCPALVQVALDPELGDEEEVVVRRVVPVDDGQALGVPAAVRLADGDRDAVAEQLVHLAVRAGVMESAAIPGDLARSPGRSLAPERLGSAVRAPRAGAASGRPRSGSRVRACRRHRASRDTR